MKNKEFYHTSVEINEYGFDKIFLEELDKELIKTIKKFNSSKNINEKIELSKQIPVVFPKCRICGKTIINSNFLIDVKQRNKTIQIVLPSIYCREIDGVKYYLSCCEECLIEHFKDDPPKSNKYYFMKANKYGAYSFGYSEEEYKKICSMTVGVTLESMQRKWGDELGEQHWKEYCNKQRISNTFEYKQQKYGWDKNIFDEFNKSRAVTKENLINKYGNNIGLEKWNNYCEIQRYTCSLEYFISKYGEIIGKEKYKNFSIKRALSGQNKKITVSKISQDLFNKLYKYIGKNEIYYSDLNHEFIIYNDETNKNYLLDFYDKTKNLVIEFQGDYWHANPQKYDKDDVLEFKTSIFENRKKIKALELWEYDKCKRNFICKALNNPIYLEIWENDYRKNPNKILQEILLYYNIKPTN